MSKKLTLAMIDRAIGDLNKAETLVHDTLNRLHAIRDHVERPIGKED